MRSSIDIPDPLFRRARKLAAARSTTLRALVLEGLRRVLEDPAAAGAPAPLEDLSFGGDGLVDGLAPGDPRIADLVYEGRGGAS